MHISSSTSVTNGAGDLIPLSPYVMQLAYGDLDYVRSVFGTTDINRYDLELYYNNASKYWTKITGVEEKMREQIGKWLRSSNMRGLDYWFPLGRNAMWFKYPEDAFAFSLKFGIK